MMNKRNEIKVYHGFGHTHDLNVFGHVFTRKIPKRKTFADKPMTNLYHLLRLFCLKPVPDVDLLVKWQGKAIATRTAKDGFFRAEWSADHEAIAGWHEIVVEERADGGSLVAGKGKIFIPHRTQYAFISDIDDTVLVSHSETKLKRMKELLFKNAHSREIFPGVNEHYTLLARAHTTSEAPNPFFYVSSSEWNLYDYLREMFDYRNMPDGAFLLNQVKRWYQLTRTGKTKHEGKLLRILRVLEVFPEQRFILMGDDSQSDPLIYATLTEKYAHRIFAVYIRKASKRPQADAIRALEEITARGIHVSHFKDSFEAIAHSKSIGLI